MDGFALLDLLKRNPDTRHIPVHVISADEQNRLGLSIGAYGFSGKPVERDQLLQSFGDVKDFGKRAKRLLVIEPKSARGSLSALLGDENVEIESVSSPEDVELQLSSEAFDCAVLDLGTSSGQSLAEIVKTLGSAAVSLIVYAPRDLNEEESANLDRLRRRSAPTRMASNTAQLQDDIALVLHRPFETLPLNAQAALQALRRCDPLRAGKKVVVIDDDIRNIFSLTSVLEQHKVDVVYAENGRDGIAMLKSVGDIDLALVDIMMPDMDGYETMRAIRDYGAFKDLPIIAVTAKAMKGDRQKCIDAGASDYVAKPVDVDLLLSLLRVWLERAGGKQPDEAEARAPAAPGVTPVNA
jgi:CheY-like chemotaxis protein